MLNWFKVKIKYEKTAEEGKIVKVSEEYLFDALSFTEAEARVTEEMKPFISGEFITADISRARINEMFANVNGDKWYRCKVYFISLDEEKGIEKRTACTMMAQANTVKDAWNVLQEGMKGSMADYEVASITETAILDVYPFSSPEEKKEVDMSFHKCNTCQLLYPECPSKNIKFGNGIGGDNIVSCDSYIREEE